MPKNRFLEILRDLHLADNQKIDAEDPYYKIRPYINMLNEGFKKNLSPSQNLSIDEMMVPYYGRHGIKQFIRGKPIRYGYKMWAITSSTGYLYHVEPYCGHSGSLQQAHGRCGFVWPMCSKLYIHHEDQDDLWWYPLWRFTSLATGVRNSLS